MDLKDIKAIIDLMRKNNHLRVRVGTPGFQDQTETRKQRSQSGGPKSRVITRFRRQRRFPLRRPSPLRRRQPRRRRRHRVAGNQITHDRHFLPGAFAGSQAMWKPGAK